MPGSDSGNAALAEYRSLREEILHSDRLVVHVLGIAFSAVAIILGQGLTHKNPYLFLIPFPLLYIVSQYVADKRWLIWVIASYIRCQLERQEPALAWESSLARIRRDTHNFTPARNVIKIEHITFILLGALCALLFVAYSWKSLNSVWECAIALGSAALLTTLLAWASIRAYFPLLCEGTAKSMDHRWTAFTESEPGETQYVADSSCPLYCRILCYRCLLLLRRAGGQSPRLPAASDMP
ncbi:MAG: hypothetical protein JXQ73_06680 [Phycisphaerae bacterium]|nr:hypothetical protein [Phycisphaerae bacterium]